MTSQEKTLIKQVKEELLNLKLQVKVITEEEFKKRVARALKLIEEMLEERTKD